MDSEIAIESQAGQADLVKNFKFTAVLNQDQGGRRTVLRGTIHDQPGLLILERAAFPTNPDSVAILLTSLTNVSNLLTNDIYRTYLSTSSSNTPDLKINLIWPCTDSHIRKYTSQRLHYVTETADIYRHYIQPWIERTQRTPKRLDWIYNILDGKAEQEDVVHRSSDFGSGRGFLLLPDLNWDRRTAEGTHLLALCERRDIWSLRSLTRTMIPWLKNLREEIVVAAAGVVTKLSIPTDADQFKCYLHYQPTYYHFHVHVVHVMLEAGGTQSVGKAFALENLISWLENMPNGTSLADVDLSYYVGEESELWKKCFARLKAGEEVNLNETE